MDAALVKLVEDDGAEIGEERILLEPGGQDAFGRDQQPCRLPKPALEADVPADLAADRPPAFDGDPARDRAGRDAPRLEEKDRAILDERRRHSRRLAGSGLGRHDDSA